MHSFLQLARVLLVGVTAAAAQPVGPPSAHARKVQQQVQHCLPGAEIVIKRPHLPTLLATLTGNDDASFDVKDSATNTAIHLTFEEVSGVRAYTVSKKHYGVIITMAIAVTTGILVTFVGLRE